MASSEQTTKRHLNKPQPEDFVNVINDICDNMDNLDDAVPDSRKVNGHALNGDITVSKSDVGLGNVDNVQQVPATRKVNNKALSSDINLQGTDIQVSSSDSRKVDAAIANCDSETASLKSALNSTDDAVIVLQDINSDEVTVIHTETSGYAIDASTGELVENSSCKYTTIDLTGDLYLTLAFKQTAITANHGYGFILSDDSWVGVHTTVTKNVKINVPKGAKTFKFSWNSTMQSWQTIKAETYYSLKSEIDDKARAIADADIKNGVEYSIKDFHFILGNVNKSTGALNTYNENGKYVRTDYIPIPEGIFSIEHNFTYAGDAGWACYNSSKVFTHGGTRSRIKIGENDKFVIFTDYNANAIHTNKNASMYNVNYGLPDLRDSILATTMKVGESFTYNIQAWINGYVESATGTINDVSIQDGTYVRTDYLTVPKGAKSISNNFTFGGNAGIAFYDSSKQYLSGGRSQLLMVPVNAKYIVMTDYNSGAVHTGKYVTFVGSSDNSGNAWYGKTWVALGDSWTEGAYVATCGRYSDYVAEALGMTQVNLGVGGSGVGSFAEQSGKPLTQEIADSADLITIYGSINDMANNGINCGDLSDAASKTGTLMARWKYTIEKVLTLNPKARIVIIGCSVAFDSARTGYQHYNTNGDTIEHSVEMIGKLARHYGLPFIDMFHLSGFNSYNFNGGYFDYDKVHPNNKGVMQTANVLIEQLKLVQPIYNPLA